MSTLSFYFSLQTMQKWHNNITKATDFSWKTNKLMQSNNSEDFLFLIESQFQSTMQDLDWTEQMKNISKPHGLNIYFTSLIL